MTDVLATPSGAGSTPTRLFTWLALPLRLAMRELRGGIAGFGILIACIALGVAVIAGVGGLARDLLDGFTKQGRVLIGGDIALRRVHQRATPAERAKMTALGSVAETATMRAMARTLDGNDQALVEIKAVDRAYPLVGHVQLASGGTLDATLRAESGTAVVAKALLDRLALKVGDDIKVGDAILRVTGVLESEPDRFAGRFAYGPRIMMSIPTLMATGLVSPGTLINWRYAITLPDGAATPPQQLAAISKRLSAELGDAGFLLKDRRNPSSNVTRLLKRLQQFLTLLGLTALLLGGLGVANAVATYVDKHKRIIATYRSLGATRGVVLATLLIQMLAISGLGVVIGLAVGIAIPRLVSFFAASALPFPLAAGIDWSGLAIAAIYGMLVALAFLLWPLARTFSMRPATLFRDMQDKGPVIPHWPFVAAQVAVIAALVGFAVFTSGMAKVALGFIGGTALVVALFWILSLGTRRAAAAIPRPASPALKLAIANLSAPGGLVRAIIISLGAGLSLLVGLSLVDYSMTQELRQSIPEKSPDYYAIDIPKADADRFRDLVLASAPKSIIKIAPMLRGRIVRLNGKRPDAASVPPEARWVLRGDRGLTYSNTVPEGSKLVKGDWWAADYSGEPLVSFGAKLAGQLGLSIGDTVTVNVLGRNITARIANLREINWESLAINFVMVFSPNTLAGAPNNYLATFRFPEGTSVATDRTVARAIAKDLPAVTLIRVKDAIQSFSEIFAKVMLAVRLAGSITLVAGGLVLAGAFAAAQSRRTQQAVILKAIGATRARLLSAHFAEYALLTLITGALAVAIGSIGAWIVTKYVLEFDFAFSPSVVVLALGLAAAFVFTLGGYRTWRILSARPVPYLRGL